MADFLLFDGISNVVQTQERADIDWVNDDYSISVLCDSDLISGSIVSQSKSGSEGNREFQFWLKSGGREVFAVIGGVSTRLVQMPSGQLAMPRGVANVFTKTGASYTLTSDGVEIASGTLTMGEAVEPDATLKIGARSNNSNSSNTTFLPMRLMQLQITKNSTLYADFNATLANKSGFVLPDSTGNFTADLVDFNPNGGFWFTQIENSTVTSLEINGHQYKTLYVGDTYVEENATATNADGSTDQVGPTASIDTSSAGTNVLYYQAGDLIEQKEIYVLERYDTSNQGDTDMRGIRSWWTTPLSVELDNGNIAATYTDDVGDQGVIEFDENNLIVGHRVLNRGFYGRDSHNAPAIFKTSSGRLITLFTGHGLTKQHGGGDKTYWCAEAASGQIADLNSTEHFVPSVANDGSNYVQIFESDSGKIVALTNMDGGGNWYPVFRTGTNTWEFQQPIVNTNEISGGGNGQYYVKGVMVGNRIRLFGMPHASNAEGRIRVIEYDVETQRVYQSNTVYVTADGTADDPVATEPVNNPAIIRQAATGRGQRLLDVSADGLQYVVAEYDNGTADNGVFILAYCTDPSDVFDPANWSEKVITTYLDESYLEKSRYYTASAVFANKPVLFSTIALSTLKEDGLWEVAYFELDNPSNDFVRSSLAVADSNSQKIMGISTNENKVTYSVGTHSSYTGFLTSMKTADLPASLEVTNPVPTVNAGANINATNGDTVTLSGATASDYDSLAWTCTSGQSPTITNGNTLTPTITFNEVGVHTLRLTATNAEGSTFDALDVDVSAVQNTNQPPVANAGPDQSISAGATCILEGSASSDSDGSIASYSWRKVSGPTIALANANQAVASFIAPSEATIQTLVFELTVTDDEGVTSAPDTVTVTVAAVPDVADPLDPTLSVISIKSKAGIEDDIPSFGVVSLYQYTDNFILCEVVSKSNTALTPDSFSQAEYRIVDTKGANVVKLGLGTGIKEADGKFLIHINSGILNSSHKGSLKHQFVVWNQAGYKLPPIFGGTVNIIPVLEPTL